ncbi:MAG: hypothetical protein MK135_08250 [Polyangiaceae bacterium]|nr:hypothetical protein [Polyangiaceae bacterium]
MLNTFLVTFCFFASAMALMALGVMIQRKRLSGSCGGVAGGDACKCTPEKQKKCRENGAEEVAGSRSLFAAESSAELSEEDELDELAHYAPPGEDRLIQLGLHAGDRNVIR